MNVERNTVEMENYFIIFIVTDTIINEQRLEINEEFSRYKKEYVQRL